jgi:hypothetical protein
MGFVFMRIDCRADFIDASQKVNGRVKFGAKTASNSFKMRTLNRNLFAFNNILRDERESSR